MLWIRAGGERLRLDLKGEDQFYARHPQFQLYHLTFLREGGLVKGAGCGPDLYLREGPDFDEQSPSYPPEWDAFPGHYRAHNPWFSNFRIFLRQGQLYIAYKIYQTSVEEPITPLPGGEFRVGLSEHSPERIRFETLVNGMAQRARIFGGDYYRSFTP